MPDSSSADVMLESSTSDAVVNEAASTPVIESTEPTSVLDAVEAALKTDGVEAGPPPAEQRSDKANPDPNGSEPAAKDENGDLSEDEKKTFSPRAQERIRDLAAQKNELRTEIETLRTEFEPLKAKASSFDTLTGYLTENNISATEANNALEITRLIKGQNYEQAYQIVLPIMQELNKRVGGVLDPDLQNDVRLGHVPLERAREIQKGRALEANTRERDQSRTEAEQKRQEQSQRQGFEQHVSTVAKAADDWAKEKAGADPDWNQKAELVAAQVNVLITRDGFPKSVAEALKVSEKALETVEASLGKFRPKPQPINQHRPTGSASARDLPAPTTALEALERGLAAS